MLASQVWMPEETITWLRADTKFFCPRKICYSAQKLGYRVLYLGITLMYYSFSIPSIQEGAVLLFSINPPMHRFILKIVKDPIKVFFII